MSIKAIIGLTSAVLISVVAVIVGCANENQPYYTIPKVSLKGGNCLKGATDTVDQYMKGEAKTSDIDGFWDCAGSALKTFQSKVEGSNPNGYTPQELRDFLERYFLGGDDKDATKIDDGLLTEVMEVKRLLIGGSNDFISRDELNRGVVLINSLKDISVELLPHVKLLFYQNNGVVPSNEQVDEASTQVVLALDRLGGIIQANNADYTFVHLQEFLKLLNTLFTKQQKSNTFDGIAKMIPLIAKGKAIVLNSSADKIAGNEWRDTFDIIGKSFAIYMRVYFFLNEKSLFDSARLDQFEKMAHMAVELFTDALGRRGNAPIRLEETDGMFDEFAKLGPLPLGLTVDQFKTMWRTIVDKILAGASAKADSGLSLPEIQRVESEFGDWLTIQHWLLNPSAPQPNSKSIDEIKMVLATPWPLSMDVEGRLVFTPDHNAQWNVESMSRMNWLRAVFRMVLLAYTKDPVRRENLTGLDKTEFAEAYQDLKPFLVASGLVDEDNTTFGDKVVREAGLFTARGNGDDILNFTEMIEYVHYILSGIDTGKLFVEGIKGECPVLNDAIDAQCFRAAFRRHFADRFANLPLMVSYTTPLSDKDWDDVLESVETAARENGQTDEPVKTSDIYEMSILLEYIETVMLRFDTNLDGSLDLGEGLAALPLFSDTLGEFMKKNPDKHPRDIRSVFTFMLRYGKPPNKKNVISIAKYLIWRYSEKSWKVNADRGVLLQILSSLSSL